MLGFIRFHPTMTREDQLNALNRNFADLEAESQTNSAIPNRGGAIGDLIMTRKATPTANRLFMNGATYNKDEYPDLWALNTTAPSYFSATTSTTFTLANLTSGSNKYEVIAKLS